MREKYGRPKWPAVVATLVASTTVIASVPASAATVKYRAATSGLPFAGKTLLVADWQGYVADLSWVDKEFEQQTGKD